MSMNVLAIGASRNIGYFTSLRLLGAGCTVTFLLRSPSTFDGDTVIQQYVASSKAHLVHGDALVEENVRHAWDEASKHGPVDLLLFTVGGLPKFSLLQGAIITPPNLVTQSLLNVLCTLPQQASAPKLIVVSSAGVTPSSHAAVPLALKPLYSYLLAAPHKDKLGVERAVAHCSGRSWDVKKDGEVDEDIMGPNWTQRAGLPSPGSLKNVLVVRPALLTDGDCKGDKVDKKNKKPYKAEEGDIGGYTVSRKDVAHFIADAALNRWNEVSDKIISIAY